MEKMTQLDELERQICSYIISKGRPKSASEIQEALKIPTLFWAEHYIFNMVKKKILIKEGSKYNMTDKIKLKFICTWFKDFRNKTIKRLSFYLSFIVTSILLIILYLIYLPKNINTSSLYLMIFPIIFIIIIVIENKKYNKFKNIVDD